MGTGSARKATRVGLVALLLLGCAAPLHAQTTAFIVHSQPGDPVGQGQFWSYNTSNATFGAGFIFQFQPSTNRGVQVRVSGGGTSWSADFFADANGPLTPRAYFGAVSTLGNGYSAGLTVIGDNRRCSPFNAELRFSYFGRFVVRELVLAGDGSILRFAADFEQHCAGTDAGLYGVIRYNSTIASVDAFDGAVPDYRLIVPRPQHGSVTADGIACSATQDQCLRTFASPQTVTLSAVADPGYVFTGWGVECLKGGATLTIRIKQPTRCEPIFEPVAAGVTYTGVFIDSLAGEAIGRGRQVMFNTANAKFFATANQPGFGGGSNILVEVLADAVEFVEQSLGVSWILHFAAPVGQPLTPGAYLAARFFPSASNPRIFMARRLDDCFDLSGRFLVRELVVGSDGSVVRFAADAEQHCNETNPDPGLFASIRYNSTIPPGPPFGGVYPEYRLTIVPGANGTVTGDGLDCRPGRPQCVRTFGAPATMALTARPDPGYALRGWIGDCAGSQRDVTLRVHSPRQCQPVFGRIAITHDLDGDALGDVVVWRPSTGTWFWGTSSSGFDDGAARSRQWGSNAEGDVPFLGDVDGDGTQDLIVWRGNTGTWHALLSGTGFTGAIERQWGKRDLGDLPMVGDLDGDSRTDFVVWRPTDGTFYWITSTSNYNQSSAARSRQWGNAALGDQPLLGDFDGDGVDDLAVWRASTGTWYWLLSTTAYDYAAARAVQWGSQSHNDAVFTGDLDGDRRSELIVWRPGDGTWYWLTSSSGYDYAAQRAQQWGRASEGDRPALLDFDGDRRLDLAVWRAPTGTWYWLPSTAGFDPRAARAKTWGSLASGDIPMVR